ncbi:condensin complex subunit SMC2 [Fistulina hepatica ATCC 64428]|uniref:Structural maintenance of chromosomes protein n=1 Tax=Fistulina hepatica ATCC 64428 TaxID=1128425 RepID=A0A0D7A0Y5_9AGAR|nr:condensin complex subunit SMC2 [Fistulina hepatica ATCC 64428]
MRIEELIIDGFKSYPVRTQITGWDASFNAITGLNGSGKSNILDAICFVLGITNISQLRCQNQQDLVYKRGQAGVTKASVTIVFDNSDKDKSPEGFKDTDQITVTRQVIIAHSSTTNKWLLNGRKSEQKTILSLFQSVQLNINNPNFVIMQGRITKVLNMKPPEILGMVEEAAGTRMFEEKKAKALKEMGKKDKRVQTIREQLNDEIEPKLDRLRQEKKNYIQYSNLQADLERLARILQAHDYHTAERRYDEKEVEIAQKGQEEMQLKRDLAALEKELKEKEQEHQSTIEKRDQEMGRNGKLSTMQNQVDALGKEVVKARTQAEIKENSITSENKKVAELEEELRSLQGNLKEKVAKEAQLKESHTEIENEHKAAQAKLSSAEELLQTLLTGLSSNAKTATVTGGGKQDFSHSSRLIAHQDNQGGYLGQIADAKSCATAAAADEQQSQVKLDMAQKELATLEKRFKEVKNEVNDNAARLERLRGEADAVRTQLERCGWNQEQEEQGTQALENLKHQIRLVGNGREAVRRTLGRLDFDFRPPKPNFDMSAIKGPVASLIRVSEENLDKTTALEIAAGGRLFNIVVKDEVTGKDILDSKQMQKHITIIPLNRISPFQPAADQTRTADSVKGATRALQLIGYPAEVKRAMEYVFGAIYICEDTKSANQVTFGGAKLKSVTIDGDVYDPSGLLTGGAKPTSNGILVGVQQLATAENKMKALQQQLAKVEENWYSDAAGNAGERRPSKVRMRWQGLRQQLEIKEHELSLLEKQVEGSNAAQIWSEIERRTQEVASITKAIVAAQTQQKEAQTECQRLEKDMKEFKNNKDGKIEELKASIKTQTAALQKHDVILKTRNRDMKTSTLEREQIEEDITKQEGAIEEERSNIDKLGKELHDLNSKVRAKEAEQAAADLKLKEERANLTKYDDRIHAIEQSITGIKKDITDNHTALEQNPRDIAQLKKERVAARNMMTQLERQHEWIPDLRDTFGKEGGEFDFSNIGQVIDRATRLEEQKKGMKRKGDPKVMTMLETVEKRETECKKNLRTVLSDKEKIEETIEQLDQHKREALQTTWTKVNKDFGDIFAELLPGNFAKLQPPEGKDLMDGLEIKVQLGSVWKQSLTELSGGQRSLIALSLIMSLLQFKPAPMYILDEIDAALDLQHTQNIGQLFRTRFKGSQFIVVSLKEGLFTNANVLFRAKFRDGTSLVERTAQRSTSSLYDKDDRRARRD